MPGRLAILSSHPVQYYAPLFREIAGRVDTKIFFAHKVTPAQQAAAGFGHAFDWDVDLLSGYDHEFLPNVAREPGVERFGGCDTPAIGERLSAGGFDALLVTGWHLKSYVQGIVAAKRRGIAVMARGDSQLGTARSLAKRAAKAATYPALLRMLDAALTVGQRNRAYYEYYGYPDARLFFSPHCVDTQRFSAGAGPAARGRLRSHLGIGDETRVVLFAGKLVEFKRPLDVVEAIALARNDGQQIELMVAGSGPLGAQVAARAAELSVPLHSLGFQNQSQMPAVYAAADALALPSTGRETWGLVCNEALACGCPIVVSDAVGSAPDLAADGTVGRVFPLGDVRKLADALIDVVRRPPSAHAMAARSASYSLAAAADGVIAAFDSVALATPALSA